MAKATHTKKKQFNRAVAVTTAIIVLIVASISTTIAFLITDTDSITNVFTPSKVTTEVVQGTNEDGYATFSIKNKDDTQAYIRAAVVVNWKNSEGHIYAQAPKEGTDYIIVIDNADWVRQINGDEVIYYYKSPVDPNNQTSALITEFRLADNANVPDGYTLSIEVLGSGIQSTPTYVVHEKWGVDVNGDGTIGFNTNG